MTPPRFEHPMEDGLWDVGDLWRVSHIEGETVTFERVVAEQGTFRKRGDGLWPRWSYPDTRPISDAEAAALCRRMDNAMDATSAVIAQAPFLPPEQVGPALERALEEGWAKPFTAAEAGKLMAEGIKDAVDAAWASADLDPEP